MSAAPDLGGAFARALGRAAAGVMRAPGRVNLIGEHIDYNGFAVLPMAIDRGLLAAWGPRDDGRVVLRSAQGFEPRDFVLRPPIAPSGPGDWGNYVKAAAQGLLDRGLPLRGADMLLDSTLPQSAGLSSSSALVVLSALVLLEAAGLSMPKPELAALLAEAEKYVGTRGGGMDQAASLLGRAGHALRIDFRPLRVTPLPLFADHVVVVANSLVRAPKAETAGYNSRAAECGRAAAAAARALGLRADPPPLLADLLAAAPRERVLAAVPPPLLPRARHVLSEAARVDAACDALGAGDAVLFGRLMNESHASCRDDFEISCDALERLVAMAREAGALGARLTGAGFGGCAIALARRADAEAVMAALAGAFYAGLDRARVSEALFVVEPADGAGPEA